MLSIPTACGLVVNARLRSR